MSKRDMSQVPLFGNRIHPSGEAVRGRVNPEKVDPAPSTGGTVIKSNGKVELVGIQIIRADGTIEEVI
jgi:hypothetical protein